MLLLESQHEDDKGYWYVKKILWKSSDSFYHSSMVVIYIVSLWISLLLWVHILTCLLIPSVKESLYVYISLYQIPYSSTNYSTCLYELVTNRQPLNIPPQIIELPNSNCIAYSHFYIPSYSPYKIKFERYIGYSLRWNQSYQVNQIFYDIW